MYSTGHAYREFARTNLKLELSTLYSTATVPCLSDQWRSHSLSPRWAAAAVAVVFAACFAVDDAETDGAPVEMLVVAVVVVQSVWRDQLLLRLLLGFVVLKPLDWLMNNSALQIFQYSSKRKE